jgi:alkanesulfonate monooxygenase SsuD/methylene tetrahydromethanopterin reductase-like flavin-dependent oxidoreductase (luciferase family)
VIKPWLFEFFPELTGASAQEVAQYFERYLRLWTHDEELGFEGIFFSEHHFGGSFSPSPHLLIAAMAGRTTRLRLGVMGTVLPYYHPARVVEEIGMLDHLTGGRLEVGTAVGVPQELSRLNLSMAQARERYDEIVEILDTALRDGVVSHRGKHFELSGLRMLPRTLQQPRPPQWTAVMGEDGARRAARRRSKICTGFSSTEVVKGVFDAYRDEAKSAGYEVGPEWLGLRRRVSLGATIDEARESAAAVAARLNAFIAQDQRFSAKVPDAPAQGGGLKISEEEFITGTPKDVAAAIIQQCRVTGAGNFLAVLHWSAPIEEVERAHVMFGREVIPLLRSAAL